MLVQFTDKSLLKTNTHVYGKVDCYFNAVWIQNTDSTDLELRNNPSSHLLEWKERYKTSVQPRKGMSCDEFLKMYDSKVKDTRTE